MNKDKEMQRLINEMKKRTCRNQLKAIAYKVSLAMAVGEKQVVISPIFDENLKTVILTYEATVTRVKEAHGLELDILSWEKDMPLKRSYMSNFFERPATFDEFKQLVEMKKQYEIKMSNEIA